MARRSSLAPLVCFAICFLKKCHFSQETFLYQIWNGSRSNPVAIPSLHINQTWALKTVNVPMISISVDVVWEHPQRFRNVPGRTPLFLYQSWQKNNLWIISAASVLLGKPSLVQRVPNYGLAGC